MSLVGEVSKQSVLEVLTTHKNDLPPLQSITQQLSPIYPSGIE